MRCNWSRTQVTVLYPQARGVRADPVHPRGGGGQVRADPAAVPGLRGAARRSFGQPARHPGGGGEDRREVDPRVRQPHHAGRPGRRGARQGRRRAARGAAARADEPPADRAGPRGADRRRIRPPTSRPCRTTGRRCTGSSTTCSSGCCASGCWRPSSRRTRPAPRASRSPAPGSRPAPCGPGWPRTRTGRVGLVVRGTWAPDGGDVHTLALAAADGEAAVVDVVGADPDDEAALAAWFADPTPDQGRPRPEAGHQRADRPRLAGRRRGLRHRAGRLPGPAGPGHLRPERPGAALPAPHPGPRPPGQLRAAALADPRRGREQRPGHRHPGHGQGQGDHRPGRRAGGAPGHRSARSRCWPTWNCR